MVDDTDGSYDSATTAATAAAISSNDTTDPTLRRNFTAKRRLQLVRSFTRSTTIHNLQHEPMEAPSVDKASILCGLAAGVVQASLFSPYDRALYLSMTNKTPFLSVENFTNPFSGLGQSIGGRALSSGLYFPLEQFFFRKFHNDNDDGGKSSSSNNTSNNNKARNFAAGTAAGAVNAMVLNPLSAIRYKTWSRITYNRGMLQEAISMLQQGGTGVFYKGLSSTLLRDVSFGGCYTFMRLQAQWAYSLPPEHQWMANLFAAGLATIVSGPFNLARNIQYSTKSSEIAPTTYQVLEELVTETRQIEGGKFHQLKYITQRLRIGWGTARVAMGMAFGHWVYDGLHGLAHAKDGETW